MNRKLAAMVLVISIISIALSVTSLVTIQGLRKHFSRVINVYEWELDRRENVVQELILRRTCMCEGQRDPLGLREMIKESADE